MGELIAEEEATRHDPYAALREANYRLFASGWLFASMGLQMQGAALLYEIFARTGDPMMLGYVGLARALPVMLLALPAGQIVDMVDRKQVLLATQVAFALASVLLTLGSAFHVNIWLMLALVSLTGCARVFNGPSRASLLPQIVRPENFHSAVTWNSGVFQLSAICGPILAGLIMELTGKEAWPIYAITGGSCLVFSLFCAKIKPYERQAKTVGVLKIIPLIRPSVLLPGMLEGARHIYREKTVLGAIALDMFAVLLGGATALMPVFATNVLGVGPAEYGFLKASPYIGAFLMALILAHRPPFKKAGRTMLLSVAAFGAFTIVFGLSKNFWLSVGALACLGAVDNISVVIRHVLVQAKTPDHLRGRVSAVNSVFIECSNEIGGFESGTVAKLAQSALQLGIVGGAVFSVVSGGIGTMIVVGVVALALPELRRLGRLQPK